MQQAQAAMGFVFRLRKQDTPMGVSAETVDKLIDFTGLTRTEVVHLALRQMADKLIPHYDSDEGDLSDQQFQVILEASPATNIPDDSFNRRLFT